MVVLELESDKFLARVTGHEYRSTFDFHVIDVATEADVMNAHAEGAAQYKPAFKQLFLKLNVLLGEPVPTFGALAASPIGIPGGASG